MEKTWLDRGTLQSEVEISDRTEQLFVSSMVQFEKSELAKLGIPHWQQIHETCLFWKALYATVDIRMQSIWYHELQ